MLLSDNVYRKRGAVDMAGSEWRPSERRKTEDEGEFAGMPRWVKALGLVVLALVLVMVAVHLAGGGRPSHSGSPAVVSNVAVASPLGVVAR
jgi:hypothetical protein